MRYQWTFLFFAPGSNRGAVLRGRIAPGLPHRAEGSFHVTGELRCVHEGGLLAPLAEGGAEGGESGEISGEGGGDLEVVGFGVGDEFGEAEVGALREAAAA